MAIKQIETIEQFNDFITTHDEFLLIKHSTTCPISQAAFEEFENYFEDHEELAGCFLTVQSARPLSNHIAETYQIKHESPQAFYFKEDKPVWHASHWKITYDALTKVKEK